MTGFLRITVCLTFVSSGLLVVPATTIHAQSKTITNSADIAWLESIVTSWDATAGMAKQGSMGRHAKDLRTAAYARLGEIGTSESLAAVRRIEHEAKTAWRKRTVHFDRWTHPSWHVSDFREEQKVAVLNVSGGMAYT